LPADSGAVNNLISSILDAKRIEIDKRSLSEAGLEQPDATVTLKATTETKKGQKGSEKTLWVKLGKELPDGTMYVSSSDSSSTPMAARQSGLAEVFKSLNFFRERTVFPRKEGDITELAIQEGQKDPVRLKKEGPDDWVFAQPADYGGVELDARD